jgi:hypothetical protein
MKSSVFWDITPFSPLKVNRRSGGTCRLHSQGRRIMISCSAYSSTPRIEAKSSSETSVDFQRTTRRYIPEDSALQTKLVCM